MSSNNKIKSLAINLICLSFLLPTNSFCQNRDAVEKIALAYVADISSENWAEIVKDKYGWCDECIQSHQEFRDAFPDYNVNVKRLLVDGSEFVLWNEISGTHANEYPHYELKGIAPTNKKVCWVEIWYFDVVDGKIGEKSDWSIDGIGRLNQLKSE